MKSVKDFEQAIYAFCGQGALTGTQACAFAGIRGHAKQQKFLKQLDSYDPTGSGRKTYYARDIARFLYATQVDIGEFNTSI